MGFEEPHLRHGLVRRIGVSPNLPYFCIFDSSGWASTHQGGLVLKYGLERPVITRN